METGAPFRFNTPRCLDLQIDSIVTSLQSNFKGEILWTKTDLFNKVFLPLSELIDRIIIPLEDKYWFDPHSTNCF